MYLTKALAFVVSFGFTTSEPSPVLVDHLTHPVANYCLNFNKQTLTTNQTEMKTKLCGWNYAVFLSALIPLHFVQFIARAWQSNSVYRTDYVSFQAKLRGLFSTVNLSRNFDSLCEFVGDVINLVFFLFGAILRSGRYVLSSDQCSSLNSTATTTSGYKCFCWHPCLRLFTSHIDHYFLAFSNSQKSVLLWLTDRQGIVRCQFQIHHWLSKGKMGGIIQRNLSVK